MNQSLFVRRLEIKEHKEEYPFTIPCIHNLKELEFNKAVTFIVGENGSGKSTLIEALAICLGFNSEGGSKNFTFSTRQTHSNLYQFMKIIKGIDKAKTAIS